LRIVSHEGSDVERLICNDCGPVSPEPHDKAARFLDAFNEAGDGCLGEGEGPGHQLAIASSCRGCRRCSHCSAAIAARTILLNSTVMQETFASAQRRSCALTSGATLIVILLDSERFKTTSWCNPRSGKWPSFGA
jgi:hypothetical protein